MLTGFLCQGVMEEGLNKCSNVCKTEENNLARNVKMSTDRLMKEVKIANIVDYALRTNAVKFNIDRTKNSPLCRLCREQSESVTHLVCGCKVLAQKEYKMRHDKLLGLCIRCFVGGMI